MTERRMDHDARIRALELEHATLKTRFEDYVSNQGRTKKVRAKRRPMLSPIPARLSSSFCR